jgi:hypothetical protein
MGLSRQAPPIARYLCAFTIRIPRKAIRLRDEVETTKRRVAPGLGLRLLERVNKVFDGAPRCRGGFVECEVADAEVVVKVSNPVRGCRH